MNRVFLLGGHDLEMLTIKKVVEEAGELCIDRSLSWNNAFLSCYSEELQLYSDETHQIFGIELKEDGITVPGNYTPIDHHNERENELSSIEQVCAILGKKIDRRLQLIAANDKAYIPGMKALGATKEEIEQIRKADRHAQGITSEEEDAAKSVKTDYDYGLCIVRFEHNHFSPVIDRIYNPGGRYLIYSNSEFTYYGKYRNKILHALKNNEDFKEVPFYFGGGENGFIGASSLDRRVLEKIVDFIKGLKHYSGHIFLSPFSWEPNKMGCSGNPLDALSENPSSKWKRTPLPPMNDLNDLYNELNFFYPFTHETLYDKDGNSHCIMHFEREETRNPSTQIKYHVSIPGKTYSLEVEYINVNFYQSGVGLLSIYTKNSHYSSLDDILAINQFGRRLFPPFLADVYKHETTPISLSLNGLEKEYSQSFDSTSRTHNSPASFVIELITSAVNNINKGSIRPILDDRMFVMSWYKDAIHEIDSNDGYKAFYDGRSDFLYKYIFVDSGSPTCQNEQMFQDLLRGAVYPRWQKWGTLYGVSRYSFVMLTTPSCPDYLIDYFETEYLRMLELVLVQRATILRFSELLTTIREKDDERFNAIYGNYISFLNRFLYPEVTAQEQGIELYDMLSKTMRVKEHADYLDNQINERQEYFELLNQRRLNEEQRFLSVLAGIAIPVSVISALFGFLFHDPFDSTPFHKLRSNIFTIPGFWVIVLSLLLTLILLIDISRGDKSWVRRAFRRLFKKTR